ncbi:unnamed protein product [Ectocarpus sp. 12 AP-2014]
MIMPLFFVFWRPVCCFTVVIFFHVSLRIPFLCGSWSIDVIRGVPNKQRVVDLNHGWYHARVPTAHLFQSTWYPFGFVGHSYVSFFVRSAATIPPSPPSAGC